MEGAVRRARSRTTCNALGGTFIAFAILSTGTTHLLDKTHGWVGVGLATIAEVSSLGIALLAAAWRIAVGIGSED